MMLAVYILLLTRFAFVLSSPVKPEPRGTALPTIELPYGVFRAASYSATSDMYGTTPSLTNV